MALVHQYKPHTGWVSSVCVTSDNKYVVSASDDGTGQITLLDTGELVHVIKVHTYWVTGYRKIGSCDQRTFGLGS